MRFLTLTIFLFSTQIVFSQKKEFCNPLEVAETADSIISEMDRDDLDDILSSKDFWDNSTYIYFNYEDIEPVVKYSEKKGFKFDEGYARAAMSEYIFLKIRKENACLDNIVEKYIQELTEFSDAKKIDGEYIPKDIEDCIKQLDELWDKDLKESFRNMTLDELNEFEAGRSLRNSWGLWNHSRLAKYFGNFGVSNPDVMSSIILKCYRRHLSGQPVAFKNEIDNFKKQEKITRQPLLKEYPKEVRNVVFQGYVYPKPKDEYDDFGVIYFFTNKSETLYWVYNHNYGWKKLTPEKYKEHKDNIDIKSWLVDIYNAEQN